jgi:hypothetical protein
MRIKTRTNIDEVFKDLDELVQRRLPIAVAIALTKTAQDVYAAEVAEMERVFDRPTPFTLKSVRYSKATPQNLEASVWLNDESSGGGHAAAEYLVPQIEGGERVEKRSEYILRTSGILPVGMSIVPGARARLDAYGNISTGLMQQVLSALRVSETLSGHTSDRPSRRATGFKALDRRRARQRAKQGEFFVAHRGTPHGRHLAPGIYRRLKGSIQPVIMFVRKPRYSDVLDFNRIGEETTNDRFQVHVREQIEITKQRVAR